MLRFSMLGSGSSGNAALVCGPNGKILIDCGLSYKQLSTRAESIGESLDGLNAVFITHEHADHVNGVGVLSRKLGTPVFMTRRTQQGLPKHVGKVDPVHVIEAGDPIAVAGMEVLSFSIVHDAADPVSFVVRQGKCQIGFATDLGQSTHLVRERLRGSNALVLEANYCPKMLEHSPYPPSICRRIAGPQGHLSNDDMAELLGELTHPELRLVVAVHISQENNTADRARATANEVLRGHDARLHVADRDVPTPMFHVMQQEAEFLDHIA